jgi:glycosyltransferase involved in cell wall biosynthesis
MPIRISVIVPTQNNEAVIGRTLQSVEDSIAYLKARFEMPAEVQVVVVDDASVDGTREAVAKFAHGKNHYTVIHRGSPSSPSCARNVGAAVSNGDLLCFLDGDDAFLERHLYECVNVLDANGSIDFVKTGIEVSDPVHPAWKSRISNSLVLNLCVRRECHLAVGGFPDLHLFSRQGDRFEHVMDVFRMYEDVFYNKVLASLYRGRGLPCETVRYYRYPGNSFDRQYEKFQAPPGQFQEESDPAVRLRIQLCRDLVELKIESSKSHVRLES